MPLHSSVADTRPIFVDVAREAMDAHPVLKEINGHCSDALNKDFPVLKAQVNETAAAVTTAASMPLYLMRHLPGFAIGLLGFSGDAGFAQSKQVLIDALTLAASESGGKLIEKPLDHVLSFMVQDAAKRADLVARINKVAIAQGMLPDLNALSPAEKAKLQTPDPLTRFLADGITVVAQGKGLGAILAPVERALEATYTAASNGAAKVTAMAEGIWDKAKRVTTQAASIVTTVRTELKQPTGWGSWIPSAIRSGASSVLAGATQVADQVLSVAGSYMRPLASMRAAFV